MPGDPSPPARRTGTARPRRRATIAVAAAAAALLLGTGCADDGRVLREPSAAQTTTTTVAAPATAGGDAAVDGDGQAAGDDPATTPLPEPMVLSSPAIAENGEFPADYTCRGRDVSPPLQWTPAPTGTVELAIVVRDVDAEGFVHWVVAGIPPVTGGLAEAAVPAAATEATNDFGRPGWAGPCPPSGTHHYDIRIYALTQPSGVAAGEAGAAAAAKVEGTPAVMSAVLSASAGAG